MMQLRFVSYIYHVKIFAKSRDSQKLYLDDTDIDCKNNCFENTELLNDDAVSHIQGLINLLTEKRTLK